MANKRIDIIKEKLEKGETLTREENRYYLKKVMKMTDEELDHMYEIIENDNPNVIID